jgi:hypothetical protein
LFTAQQIVEKVKKLSSDMQGRVMAVLHCDEGFLVTAENYSRIPVLGYDQLGLAALRCVRPL